ncbi:hypothetical protein Acr_23g0001550 [Actinidia rufa]|uniref:Avr9/Cf-9 rapidly elicited protein n=1 Tax=Actinidia rufa TaxID=165716 RepID=A0A7J0GLV3_9ERIC|nr:hypothetical protein Acr_23g0001550 [Actinidia rufa]
MENANDLPVVAKRMWKIVRVLYFMLRKSISKSKLMVDLNMMMKRGKIAGKAMVHNLIFHHHNHSAAANRSSHSDNHLSSAAAPHEYEFSCSNTPSFPFHVSKRKHQANPHSHFFACANAPPTEDDKDEVIASPALTWHTPVGWSEVASPALPGFGRSPAVRQLRITDSPFPLRDLDEDCHVDEAAEKFIAKFYNALRKQNAMALP